MTIIITDECINCRACELQCFEVCPVDCCMPDPNHQEDKASY